MFAGLPTKTVSRQHGRHSLQLGEKARRYDVQPHADHALLLANVFITLLIVVLAGVVVIVLRSAPLGRLAAVLTALAAVLGAIPAILLALHG